MAEENNPDIKKKGRPKGSVNKPKGKGGRPKGLRHTPETIAKMKENGGRPKYWTEWKLDELALCMDEWSKGEDADMLIKFCTKFDVDADTLFEKANESINFSRALKTAKARIAERIHDRMTHGQYNYGNYMRVIGMYDPTLNKFERAEKKYEADLKARAEENKAPQQIVIMDYSKSKDEKKS